ncbi:MAG: serine/threonine-protein kinase, partial [Verrucomicrobia bacterium]|nr:serine/threonine-protein kinase [Verrucomicrobiota bacterium]
MSAEPDHLIQACPSCGALIDGAEAEPFALVECPSCLGSVRVRRFFDHFELEEELGVGGMGTVYRALDRNLGRSVALKLLQKEQSKNPEFIAQFAHEAAITAAINHPHVVKVFSTGQDHGLVYIAMELVDQGSLDDRLTRLKILEEEEVLTMGIQVAEGLNAAFQRGLIHRDVKPGNILFSNAKTAKIVDFGLAVLMEHAGTVMGEIWGTPAYVAPEKLDNRREDLRSDIYSLGATLFHGLTGVPPCDLETNQMSVLLEAKRKQPALRTLAKGVSEATAFAIDKTLKFEPGERFQSYEELIKALEYARREVLARGAGKVRPASKKAFPVMPIVMG